MAPFIHHSIQIEPFVTALGTAVIGYLVARFVSSATIKTIIKHLTPQQSMLLRRILFYFILSLFLASAIQELGFKIGALLGAAGILTVAIGIASQTSMSNIISGIFMIGERPFEVGHVVKIDVHQGEILSIDLLSVKLRTPENTMLRIPNETLIKAPVTNLSYFPIRRLDIKFSVAYKEDLNFVRDTLFLVAKDNPMSLAEPKPQLQILDFGDPGINLQFSIWVNRPNFSELKNAILMQIKKIFEHHDILIPLSKSSL
jgi:small-conductance mechanosensitive channel